MSLPRPPVAVVFDFDGVIVESVEIKGRAFPRLFPDRPDLHFAIRAHHEEHLGLSRVEKIEWILRNLLREAAEPERIDALARRFSELVVDEVVACPAVAGATAILERLRERSIPAFLASGTPQEELETIVARRGLAVHFLEVAGSPRRKPEILADLLRRHRLDPSAALMVGDGASDWRAASDAGVPFVHRPTTPQPELERAAVPTIRDLTELPDLIGV